jgi:Protein of unknown function (DUF3667)
MATTCLNCGAEIQHQFCPYCGQKKDVEKLNWHSLVHEITHFFTHIEKGFLNTSFQLIIRPGRVMKEYLEGKRKKYHKPVSFYLIWAAIRLVTFTFVIGLMHYENFRSGNALFGSKEEATYIVKHNQVFGLLLIPIQSFFIWIIVSRPKLNYIETLTVSIYSSAIVEMLIFFQIFIVGLLLRTNFLTNSFVYLVQAVYTSWSFFCLMDLFKKDRIKFLPLRALLVLIISFLVYQILARLIAGFILELKQ